MMIWESVGRRNQLLLPGSGLRTENRLPFNGRSTRLSCSCCLSQWAPCRHNSRFKRPLCNSVLLFPLQVLQTAPSHYYISTYTLCLVSVGENVTGRRINKTLKACTLTECNGYCHAVTALCYPIIIDPPGGKCFLPAVWDAPGGSDGKEAACNADQGLIPELGSCGEGNGNPLQYSCLPGNPMDRGTWRAIVHGVAKSQT